VLFHRRRTKDCGGSVVVPTPKPTPVPTRTFVVYLVKSSAANAAATLDRIRTGKASSVLLEAVRVGDAIFLGGTWPLTPESQQSFPALWAAASPGPRILGGILGASGAAVQDGVPLARQRVDGLTKTLSPITPTAPGAPLLAVPNALVGFDSTGRDGGIVLITEERVVKKVEHMAAVMVSRDVLDRIASNGIDPAKTDFGLGGTVRAIGHVDFYDDVPDGSLDALFLRWSAESKVLKEVWLVGRAGVELLKPQGQQIANRLQTLFMPPTLGVMVLNDTLPMPAVDVVTLLVPGI
jgi:hypothetical protein